MGDGDADTVSCRSDHTYAQRPVALRWEGQHYEVKAVESEWRTPTGHFFRVCTSEGLHFELFYCESNDEWGITPQ
jgi:hypothetical protein